ncbi:MAG: acyl-CoA dehydrogenase family protein [Thermoanaerobaculia bacterium]|nr:acyl-CoA dehydrogenase family protein [Thermoanaerobaculia bacterium]
MTVAEDTETHSLDFSLTDEQKVVRDTAREFARREIDPIVEEIDEAQRFPLEVMQKAGELGFLGIIFPEEYGGAGMGYLEYVLVVTELSKIDPSVGISVAAHNSLCTNHIFKFGNEEQRRRWVAPLASGERIGAWGLTEPGAGSDAGGAKARAEKTDGGWILNGTKTFITHGKVGEVAVVMAVTEPEADRGRHLSAFVVEKGMEGFRAGKKEDKLGIRASDTTELVFEDCFVPDDHLLGERGTGFKQAMEVLDGGRISIAALGLGTALGAYETALEYAKEREQFGRPIADFQAIQFHLAEMATRIAASEALTFAAAAAMDDGGEVSLLASEAKLLTGETAVFCAERGVQIHGGYGFIKEYRAEKFYRDAKICTIGEGTSEIQRLVIARQLLGGGRKRS